MTDPVHDPLEEPVPAGQQRYLLTLPETADPSPLREALEALARAEGVVRRPLDAQPDPLLRYYAVYADLTDAALADIRRRVPELAVENALLPRAPLKGSRMVDRPRSP